MSQSVFASYGGYPKAVPKEECMLRGLRSGGRVSFLIARFEAWNMVAQVVASESMTCNRATMSRPHPVLNTANGVYEGNGINVVV